MSGFPSVNFSETEEGLFSPAEVRRLMRVEFDRAKRYGYPAAAMLVEVDRLEYLHDLYGWESKQEILRSVIRLLRSTTRDSDFLGCMHADRILVVFPHTPVHGKCRMVFATDDGGWAIDGVNGDMHYVCARRGKQVRCVETGLDGEEVELVAQESGG